MSTIFAFNGKRYITATLKAIANQGALLEIPTELLVQAPGVDIRHEIPIVTQCDGKYIVLAGEIPAKSEHTSIRLLSKIILKKAQQPPAVAVRQFTDQAPTRARTGWAYPSGTGYAAGNY